MLLLRKLLFPVSLLYALVVLVRNWCYDIGIFRSTRFITPIICIGNLSVGGTGKTPMIAWLIGALQPAVKVAVLSRGYKRTSTGFLMASKDTGVLDIGDEPYQLFSQFPNTIVAVDADRRNGIKTLEKSVAPDVILLDDAFQHRRVQPHFSMLLTTFQQPYTGDWYLPTGDLRDSVLEAKRADVIVVTKCPTNLSMEGREQLTMRINPLSHQKVLFSYLAYLPEIKSATDTVGLAFFKNKNLSLVTGIANPKPLVVYLKEEGVRFEHLAFADHHQFTEKEIEIFQKKELILTTEKDYTRLKDAGLTNVYYLSIAHRFMGDDRKVLLAKLREVVKA